MIKVKQLGLLMGLGFAALAARGATVAMTNINSPVINPSLNAVTIVNNSTVTASNTTGTYDLFKFQNARNVTNRITGLFTGFPGYEFSLITNGIQYPLANFMNQGTISATGGLVNVWATNLVHPGNMIVTADGVARLKGVNLNLNRAGLQAGAGAGQSIGFNITTPVGSRRYQNPGGIKDIYWGAGTNFVMFGARPAFDQDVTFFETMYSSPFHEVFDRRVSGRQFLTLTNDALTPFSVYVYQRRTQPTNFHYYIVYLGTNTPDSNVTAEVRFNDFNTGDDTEVYVEIRTPGDTDAVTGLPIDNRLTFIDRLGPQGNALLSTNIAGLTFRPRAFEITRYTPGEFISGNPSNASLNVLPFDPLNPLVPPPGAPNHVPFVVANFDSGGTIFNDIGLFRPGGSNGLANSASVPIAAAYAAYGAQLGAQVFTDELNPGSPSLSDPTNELGRVEIEGQNVDLSLTRVRAESLLSIRATNSLTISNTVLDAPIINLSLTNTTQPVLTLTNVLPSTVRRFHGHIYAWAADWENDYILTRPVSGNSNATAFFHVLMLDLSKLRVVQSVLSDRLAIASTNVVMNNAVRPGRGFVVDARALTFESSNTLTLASSALNTLDAANLPSLQHFTNDGVITVVGHVQFGTDRPEPVSNIVNRGTILSANHAVHSRYYQNTGSVTSTGGPIEITAADADVRGAFTSFADIQLAASNLTLNGHTASSGATLNLIATNSLSDGGTPGTNTLVCNYGFNLPRKPATGDLYGTALTTLVPAFAPVSHVWAGEDRGATAAGFTNNTVLGRLTVYCANSFSLAAFTGAGVSNAIYVDHLDLQGAALTEFASTLSFDTNITLYFASANVAPESLEAAFGGRVRWMRSFLGPNSGTQVTLASGQAVTVNGALLLSSTIDSDGDGVANAADAAPLDVPISSQFTYVDDAPVSASISWNAAAQTAYRVEYSTTLGASANWQLLTLYTNSAASSAVATVADPGVNGVQRYYRVSYTPQ